MLELLANIDVDDLAKATDFYSRALGLRLGRRFDGVAEMVGASSAVYLLAKGAGSTPVAGGPQRRVYGRHWTPGSQVWVTAAPPMDHELRRSQGRWGMHTQSYKLYPEEYVERVTSFLDQRFAATAGQQESSAVQRSMVR